MTRFIYGVPIPVLSTSVPSRILILAVFFLSVLAGFGADYLLSQKRMKEVSKPMIFVGLLIFFTLLYAIFLYKIDAPCPSVSILTCRMTSVRTTLFELFVFLSCSLFFLISIKIKAKWIQNIFILMSIFVFAGAELYNAEKLLPFSPKEMMYPKSEVIEKLQELSGSQWVFGIGDGKISTNIATEVKVLDPEYYDPLYIKRYGEFIAYANQGIFPPKLKRSDVEIVRDATVSAELQSRRNRLLDLLSVRYLYGKQSDFSIGMFGASVWQNASYHMVDRMNALPKAHLVHQYTVKKSQQEILSTLFDPLFDPHTTAVIEVDPSLNSPELSIDPKGGSTPIITEEVTQSEYLKFSVKTSAPGIFVLTDNYYPGWHARVDGKETEIFRANYSFRGVFLEEGEHTVEFFYKSESLWYGCILSLLSIVVLVLYCGCAKNRT